MADTAGDILLNKMSKNNDEEGFFSDQNIR